MAKYLIEMLNFNRSVSKVLPIICEFLWGTKGVEALLELVPPKGVSDWNNTSMLIQEVSYKRHKVTFDQMHL